MGAGISGEVLTIVAKKMTMKAFGQRTSRSGVIAFRLREDLSRRREDLSAIWESDVLWCVLRDGEGMVFFICVAVIRGGRVYYGGRRGSGQGRR